MHALLAYSRCSEAGISLGQDGSTLTGFAAREQAADDPLNTFSSVKRLIGRRYGDVSAEAAQLPYNVADSASASSGTAHSRAAAAVGTAAADRPATQEPGQESIASGERLLQAVTTLSALHIVQALVGAQSLRKHLHHVSACMSSTYNP